MEIEATLMDGARGMYAATTSSIFGQPDIFTDVHIQGFGGLLAN